VTEVHYHFSTCRDYDHTANVNARARVLRYPFAVDQQIYTFVMHHTQDSPWSIGHVEKKERDSPRMTINAGQRSHAVRDNLHGGDDSSVRNSGDKSSQYASHT